MRRLKEDVPKEPRYACPTCGGKNVQFQFPCWVDANGIHNKEKYELDYEAQPEKNSDKGWCAVCNDHKLLNRIEED